MDYTNRMYMINYPNPALVASQLTPEQFAKHYILGSTRHFDGRLIFTEVDIDYRHEYFAIDKALKDLVPHDDGRPKATKFVSSYRVLEHIDFNALGSLYLATPAGYTLELKCCSQEYEESANEMRIFAEITPLRMLVLSKDNFMTFADFITAETNPKGAPNILYTQLEFNIPDFLEDFELNPLMRPPIPGLHPSKLRDAIFEIRKSPTKTHKGLSLDSPVDKIPAEMFRHGFMFASRTQKRFYPMPPAEIIEKENYKFFRTMR